MYFMLSSLSLSLHIVYTQHNAYTLHTNAKFYFLFPLCDFWWLLLVSGCHSGTDIEISFVGKNKPSADGAAAEACMILM